MFVSKRVSLHMGYMAMVVFRGLREPPATLPTCLQAFGHMYNTRCTSKANGLPSPAITCTRRVWRLAFDTDSEVAAGG